MFGQPCNRTAVQVPRTVRPIYAPRVDLIDRLKAVKRPSLSGAQEPAEQSPPPPPSFLAVRTSGPHSAAAGVAAAPRAGGSGAITISPVWLGAIGVLLAACIGWIVYSAADHGIDAGIGVFVAWPTLLLMAAIVTAPFALIAVLLYLTFTAR